MESVPSTSTKKRKVSHISKEEKVIIVNVYKFVQETWPSDKYQSKTDMKNKTANILGIGKTTVYRVLKEYKENGTVKPPVIPKKSPNLIETVDDFVKSCIRRKVHEFYLKGELPTLNKILEAVNSDDMLPNFSRTSLWRLLKHLKFKYAKKKWNSAILERHDIVLWRIKYLKKIRKYREERRPIYFLNETWVNADHTINEACENTTMKTPKQKEIPTSKGNHLIVVHIGGDRGFLPVSQWVFENKATDDYEKTMRAHGFKNWFKNALSKVEPNAVIVIDNVSYYSRHQEQFQFKSWRKQALQEWLSSKEIQFKNKESKAELLVKVQNVKDENQSNVANELAKQAGIEVLRLPPYHCELNPIELVWADVKEYVARNNTTLKMVDVKKLLDEGISKIDIKKWKNCIDHIIKEENKLNALDHTLNDIDFSTGSSSENDCCMEAADQKMMPPEFLD